MKINWLLLVKYLLLSSYKSKIQQAHADAFVAGVYEKEHRYAGFLTRDTITIRCLSEITGLFIVERRTVRGIDEDHSSGEQICTSEDWLAPYHSTTHQLVSATSDRTCSFVPEAGLLLFDNKQFRKTGNLSFYKANV
jgi:hypothetical protein